jgi:2-haloacid dehalogenase
MSLSGKKPDWLTFDCYGTLIQWDEGIVAAIERTLERVSGARVSASQVLASYDRRELALEQSAPFRKFKTVVSESLRGAFAEFGVDIDDADVEHFTSGISAIPPFPEAVAALRELKNMGFRLCIISNTEDDIIAGNVAQLGGTIDRVITAEQARAYKPSPKLFNHAYEQLATDRARVVHICASPDLDLTAAHAIGFRCIWIDRGTGRKAPGYYTADEIRPNLTSVPGLLARLE